MIILRTCIVLPNIRKSEYSPGIPISDSNQHCRRCLALLREYGKRMEVVDYLIDAANSARSRGAHEVNINPCEMMAYLKLVQIALDTYVNVWTLIGDGAWASDTALALSLQIKLAE
jgi:hypothetical protein